LKDDLGIFERRNIKDEESEKKLKHGVQLCNIDAFKRLFDNDYLSEAKKDDELKRLCFESGIDVVDITKFVCDRLYSTVEIADFFSNTIPLKQNDLGSDSEMHDDLDFY
jgi:hypothetical protein